MNTIDTTLLIDPESYHFIAGCCTAEVKVKAARWRVPPHQEAPITLQIREEETREVNVFKAC